MQLNPASTPKPGSTRTGIATIPILIFLAVFLTCAPQAHALHADDKSAAVPVQDSDGDGLSDSLEAALLSRFSPVFMVSRTDCSTMPAQFQPETSNPTVVADNGTIYGQAFPRKGYSGEVELHYYHLWRKDCGQFGHPLDAEHVSALVKLGSGADSSRALYWYAAAHEDTICDASHLVRANDVAAAERGPTVWISSGKHGSFLSQNLCSYGCGGDRCEQMRQLPAMEIVNVGETGAPMNGIAWLLSPQWPLEDKLQRSDFTDLRLTRADDARHIGPVWANPSKRPAQAAISGANAGMAGAATGAQATDNALDLADNNTGAAIGAATEKTGDALNRSSRNVWNALKKSAGRTGELLNAAGKHKSK